jgi:hypothetical protein
MPPKMEKNGDCFGKRPVIAITSARRRSHSVDRWACLEVFQKLNLAAI